MLGGDSAPDGLIAKQISLGFSHSCALKIDNTVECWGKTHMEKVMYQKD
ncbi:RCC1 domain-containing protein [Bathymodiolus heckerae thiotrophic gill symbiont]